MKKGTINNQPKDDGGESYRKEKEAQSRQWGVRITKLLLVSALVGLVCLGGIVVFEGIKGYSIVSDARELNQELKEFFPNCYTQKGEVPPPHHVCVQDRFRQDRDGMWELCDRTHDLLFRVAMYRPWIWNRSYFARAVPIIDVETDHEMMWWVRVHPADDRAPTEEEMEWVRDHLKP